MTPSLIDVLNRLHDSRVDFVIVGGVAAALHGSTRVTFDLDVVPKLVPESWATLVDMLWALGARPRIPDARRAPNCHANQMGLVQRLPNYDDSASFFRKSYDASFGILCDVNSAGNS